MEHNIKDEYSCEPKPANRLAKTLTVGSAVLAVVLWGTASVDNIPIPLLWQLGAVVLMTIAIMLITRYLLKQFIYTFYRDENEETVDEPEYRHWAFKIVEVQSRSRRRVVCHLDAADILSVVRVSDNISAENARNEAHGLKVYNYCSEMKPAVYAQMIMRNGEENLCIRFVPDDEMYEAIRRMLKSQKETVNL